jgi:hypothetical protein
LNGNDQQNHNNRQRVCYAKLGLTPKQQAKKFESEANRMFALYLKLERVKGIEPSSQAWEAYILPLDHTRFTGADATGRIATPFLPDRRGAGNCNRSKRRL